MHRSHAPYAIITAADGKVAPFLIRHWLLSFLSATADRSRVDIIVLDYGLPAWATTTLRSVGAHIHTFKKHGSVTALRFCDIPTIFEKKTPYEQVMMIDCGDVIFQPGWERVFEGKRSKLSVLIDEHTILDWLPTFRPFLDIPSRDFRKLSTNHHSLNAGVIVGPFKKFMRLCTDVRKTMKRVDMYGIDQAAVIYHLYQSGFEPLSEQYNFTPMTAKMESRIAGGMFYDTATGRPIPIVHNAGGAEMLRPIERFGFGSDRNVLKQILYHSGRIVAKTVGQIRRSVDAIVE
jgi:hypothetical protein